MWFFGPFLTTLLVIVSFLLVVVILMQRPKSEGLGAAFGSNLTDNLFGTQTTNILGKVTVWLGVAFFLLTLLLSILHVKETGGQTTIEKALLSSPAASPAPSAVASPSSSPVVKK